MLKVAMISKWHVHAPEYARRIVETGRAQITCVWDEDAARGEAWAKELGVDFVADYDALLARPDVDAVILDTPTNLHKDMMIRAANAGKHIYTEKVMCLTVADCDEVIEAVERNHVIFTISFPKRAWPCNLFIKDAIDKGVLGDITAVRVRNAHDGASGGWLPEYWFDPVTTGGGAMMDLGAHPMYISSWLLGKPTRIVSMFNGLTGHAVEDNSVCAIEFEGGAIAVSETSLVSPMTPDTFEVYGTKGVIIVTDNQVRIKTADDKEHWHEPELPAALPHPIEQWVTSVLDGAPVRYGTAEGRALTQLMEGAYIAHREKREVQF
ncbi:MAG: Gfo/Idh/MocA family oxidoreductase [Eubacteriales bacterium]|nr:Gfo/Idh/MocA family oxidoreductase [Eubacteriales bacterium]